LKELLRFFLPSNYHSTVLHPDYPWLSLNIKEWLQNPRQWPAAFRIAWGNHQLAKRYLKALKQGKIPDILQEMQSRIQESWDYLEHLNKNLKNFFREPRGSLLIATSLKQQENLFRYQELLKREGQSLQPLTAQEVQEKYGFLPRGALCFMEKKQDFIFAPDFLNKIVREIQQQGGAIKTNWHLSKMYLETDKQEGGLFEFYERNESGEKIHHYRRFSRAHLSLGPTSYSPPIYDLLSVTGVSMNVLLVGVALKGGPMVCGQTNHLVPLLPPQVINMKDPLSGVIKALPVSFARLSAAGSVSPLNRGCAWYTYDGRQAVHLLHRVRESLPPEIKIQVLSVTGCNRVIGKDGRQIEVHPTLTLNNKKIICPQVTIQIGAGGGGLTQMGAVPKKMKKS